MDKSKKKTNYRDFFRDKSKPLSTEPILTYPFLNTIRVGIMDKSKKKTTGIFF